MTAGPLALLGGGEHRDGCEVVDRWLLDRAGSPRPRVTVIPAASTRATLPGTAALARNWWAALGARVTVAAPDRGEDALLAALDEPDLVVLTGGVPGRLVAALGPSPAWERVLDLWQQGTALSGSSAGAMALFEWRLRLRAPTPLGLAPGLGPLTGHVVVPHYDRLVTPFGAMRAAAVRRQRRYGGLAVLGLDERTALVTHDGQQRVLGAGRVTLLDRHGEAVHPAGATLDDRAVPAGHDSAVIQLPSTSVPQTTRAAYLRRSSASTSSPSRAQTSALKISTSMGPR